MQGSQSVAVNVALRTLEYVAVWQVAGSSELEYSKAPINHHVATNPSARLLIIGVILCAALLLVSRKGQTWFIYISLQ